MIDLERFILFKDLTYDLADNSLSYNLYGAIWMMRLYLIGCGKEKKDGIHKAKDLYDSGYFKLKKEYVERHGFQYYILSAEHGLLNPEKEIEKYNKQMKDLSKEDLKTWVANVVSDLSKIADNNGVKYIFLAGRDYWNPLIDKLGKEQCELPLAHLRIGKQMEYLKEAIHGQC